VGSWRRKEEQPVPIPRETRSFNGTPPLEMPRALSSELAHKQHVARIQSPPERQTQSGRFLWNPRLISPKVAFSGLFAGK
jgi:hypothetical protein